MAKKKSGKNKSSATKNAAQNAKTSSITDSINTEVIAEALSTANQPVLLKLCRLCEAKDGPFLNIFEADKVIAKKIDDLLPFVIEEHDDLPHKICFRCSAKVEELHEFVQKCIRTQENLRKAVGNMAPLATKTKTRALWEEKLNKSNMSNEDICNALIQKAMEGIKDIPLNPPIDDDDKPLLRKESTVRMSTPVDKDKQKTTEKEKQKPATAVKETELKKDVDNVKKESEPVKQGKAEKIEQKTSNTRSTRTSTIFEPLFEGLRSKSTKQLDETSIPEKLERGVKRKAAAQSEDSPSASETQKTEKKGDEIKPEEPKKPFDIMDHISMIKVNGVGVLFQCKLCNRNFLKKEVVMSHSCAKHGGPKHELIPDYVPPIIPKAPTVKYINTKTECLHKPAVINETPIVLDDDPPPPSQKSKPKAGPASKVNKNNSSTKSVDTSSTKIDVIPTVSSQVTAPTVQFPSAPSLNSRYKLVPGPNNTFTLVEEKIAENAEYVSSDDSNSSEGAKVAKDKKKTDKSKQNELSKERSSSSKKSKVNDNVIEEKPSEEKDKDANQPYPVGLIKKVGHHSNDYQQQSEPVAFSTPAMKKQSYTIVQTGNPSKLLISTKPQPTPEEVPKKKIKKSRQESKDEGQQPFSVTLEDASPPKDPGFFTFINVDPLLQPSYVLPTHNIIQESQISTSTPINSSQAKETKDKDSSKYPCNMCGEVFSREKKLLSHIHSHYNKMDQEDQLREKTNKKRMRRS